MPQRSILNLIQKKLALILIAYLSTSFIVAQGAPKINSIDNNNPLIQLISKKNKINKKILYESKYLTIYDGYINASIGKSTSTAAYMTIVSSRSEKIIKLASPNARKIEIHSSYIDDKGVMKMRRIENIKISKSKPFILKPGGYHFMVMGLKKPLESGQTFPLIIFFENGKEINLSLNVLNLIKKKHMKNKHKH